MRANPYTLAKDIYGIGFKSADIVAQKLGIARDSMIRALAGITHALLEATGEGHCALPREMLIEQAASCLRSMSPSCARHSSDCCWTAN